MNEQPRIITAFVLSVGVLLAAVHPSRAADCNSNGIDDTLDISGGTSRDCNTNAIPDECDIAQATSADCDTNGIPDECQPDCNVNGIADRCDVAAGTSADINVNLIPDECEGQMVFLSREFSVYNHCYDETTSDAFSREFSVYNYCYDVEVNDAFSREFSVYLPPLVPYIEVSPAGAGATIPAACTPDHGVGEAVPVAAVASNGFDFASWTDSGGGTLIDAFSPCTTVIMNDNTTVTANFVPAATITVTWTGGGDGVSWSDPANWCPPVVPDETGPDSYHAIISGGASIVQLDISPTITSLDVTSNGVVEVVPATGSQSLTVSGGIVSTGTLRVGDGLTFTIAADINQTGGGQLQVLGAGMGTILRIDNGVVTNGSLQLATGVTIDLVGTARLDGVAISGLVVPDGATVTLDGSTINQDTMFVDATAAGTAIETSTGLTISPPVAGTSDLVLGDEAFAVLGNAGAAIVNDAGHTIHGAGFIRGDSFANVGVVGAESTLQGGAIPETLTLEATTTSNSNLLHADGGFTLALDGTVDLTSNGFIEATAGGVVLFNNTVTGVGTLRALAPCSTPLRGCVPPILSFGSTSSTQVGSIQALDTGLIQVNGGAAVNVSANLTLDGGSYEGVAPTTAALTAGSVILGSALGATGSAALQDSMSMNVLGAFQIVPCSGFARGCVPPILTIRNSAGAQIGGDFSIQTAALILVDSTVPVALAGDFDNRSTGALLFDWSVGSLTLNGMLGQVFEAAGADIGATAAGLVDNFAMGRIEVTTNGIVTFANATANTFGTLPCDEAVYVRDLVLRAGASVTLSDVRIYYGTLVDEGATVTLIGCGQLVHNPTGDFGGDGVIDLNDYTAFEQCLGGPNQSYGDPACQVADFDADGDIDAADFAVLQAMF